MRALTEDQAQTGSVRGHTAWPKTWYAATATPAPVRSPLRGEVRCDVAILGGGFTGVSAALELAERGYSVRLIEARRVGWGATGRCGGQLVTGFAPGMAVVEAMIGREAARGLFAAVEEGKRLIAERTARHAISCDLRSGFLHAALKPRQLAAITEDAELLATHYSYDQVRMVDAAGIRAEVASERYIGGALDAGGGHLHPLNYALGIAAAAERAGAILHEDSAATAIATEPHIAVVTADGVLRPRFLVIAGDAYLDRLAPTRLSARTMPVATYMVATEPLGPDRAAALIPNDLAVSDANVALDYYRRTSDHRLLFGGGASYRASDPRDLKRTMAAKINRVFPSLADTMIDYAWSGLVGITRHRLPHFGRLAPDVFFAQGYSGQGAILTTVAGRVIAEAIAGHAERLDVFDKLPQPAFLGGRAFRMPLLVAAMSWFKLRDLL